MASNPPDAFRRVLRWRTVEATAIALAALMLFTLLPAPTAGASGTRPLDPASAMPLELRSAVSPAPYRSSAAEGVSLAANRTPCTANASITGEGSTIVGSLMDQWADALPGSVNYDATGSPSGITAISTKIVDFGASEIPLDQTQRLAAPGLLTIPEAASAVVPIDNLPGVPKLNFNGSVLAQIYDGQVTSWNSPTIQQLNPGVSLPSTTIVPVYRSGASGTTFVFSSFLTSTNAYWATHYGKNVGWPSGLPGVASSGDGGVLTTVAATAYAIGYVDLPFSFNSSVQAGSVENPAGKFVAATVASVQSAVNGSKTKFPTAGGSWYNTSILNSPGRGDYPISDLTYLLVYKNLSSAYPGYSRARAQTLTDFLDYVVTTGQSFTAGAEFAELPSVLVRLDTRAIDSILYDGHKVGVCTGFSVRFTEKGLASGTEWSVRLGGVSLSATGTAINFTEPNGTYAYTVGAVSGYTSNPSNGSLTVHGKKVTIAIKFQRSASVGRFMVAPAPESGSKTSGSVPPQAPPDGVRPAPTGSLGSP